MADDTTSAELEALKFGIRRIADSLEPHTEHDTIKALLALLDGTPPMADNSQATADVIAEAFKAGMLAGFSTSFEGWNGGYLDIRDGTPHDQALAEHIDEEFPRYFAAYLTGDEVADHPTEA
jgi:hypothetical protein